MAASGMNSGRIALGGELSITPLLELLVTLEAKDKTGQVRVITEAGVFSIWFCDGLLIDAEHNALTGERVMSRLVGVSEGRFEVEYGPAAREVTIGRSVKRIYEQQAARRSTWRERLGQVPDLHAILVPGDASAFYGPEAELLALFDGRRCVLDVIEASGHDAPDVIGAIRNLLDRGELVQNRSLSRLPPGSGFIPHIPRPPKLPSSAGSAATASRAEMDSASKEAPPESAPKSSRPGCPYSVRPNSVEVVHGGTAESVPSSSVRPSSDWASGRVVASRRHRVP